MAKAVKVCDLKNNYNGLDNIPKPADRKRLAAKYAAALLMAGE